MTRMQTVGLVAALLTLAACSKPASDSGNTASSDSTPPSSSQAAAPTTTAAATPAAASGATGNACDRKLIAAADVAPLLSEPISGEETLTGDAQTCEFKTAGFSSVHVSLRPGLGHATLDQIISGGTNQTVTPLVGVGDRAVWDANLKQVSAEKDGTLCEVGAIGLATKPATAEKVGALCSKIFAAGK
jgi:hypothetical protein